MALLDSYLSLITSQHKNKPKFEATVSNLLQYSEDVFRVATYMDDEFNLDLTSGYQQNILGDMIGIRRECDFAFTADQRSTLNDDEYRVLQRAKIIKNHWNGKIEDLYEKWMILFGSPILIKDNQDMTLDIMLDIDESAEMQALIKFTAKGLIVPKPQSVRFNYQFKYPDIFLPWPIYHRAEIMQYVNATHYIWTDVAATENIFDGSISFDGNKTFSGLTTQAEKNKQKHKLELMQTISALQRNRVAENIFDGAFNFDGSKCFDGQIFVEMPHLKVFTTSHNQSKYKQNISFTNKINNQINAKHDPKIKTKIASITPTKNHHKPRRTANEFDGGFCMDGSHEFDGEKIVASITNNLCTVEQNGKVETL